MNKSEELIQQVGERLNALFNLPPASGTGPTLAAMVVDAAVARIAEAKASQQQIVGVPADNNDPSNLAGNHRPEFAGTQPRTLNLPRKDRK